VGRRFAAGSVFKPAQSRLRSGCKLIPGGPYLIECPRISRSPPNLLARILSNNVPRLGEVINLVAGAERLSLLARITHKPASAGDVAPPEAAGTR
jgi:hypothetical protein